MKLGKMFIYKVLSVTVRIANKSLINFQYSGLQQRGVVEYKAHAALSRGHDKCSAAERNGD